MKKIEVLLSMLILLAFGYSDQGGATGEINLNVSLPALGNWIGASNVMDYYPFMRDTEYSNRPENQRWYSF